MLRTKLFDGLKRISTPFRTRNHHHDRASRRRGFRRPRFESLESRTLLSAGGPDAFAETEEYRDVTGIEMLGHIVVFDDSTNDVKGLAKGLGNRHGFNANMIYEHAIKGVYIPVDLPESAIDAIEKNPNVAYVKKNMKYKVERNAQTIDFGIQRVLAPQAGQINGIDEPTNVTVAIVEQISTSQSDLRIDMNLSFGYEEIWTGKGRKRTFQGWGPRSHDPQWWDEEMISHGTHVSGTVAAIDNDQGVVGIAEGATVMAADFFDENNSYIVENLAVDGFDFLAQNASTISVMNMSWSMGQSQPMDDAIQGCIDAGIVAVASAGNNGNDYHNVTPRSVPGVIVVSNIVDTDGLPGGLGPDNSPGQPDDSLNPSSNYGSRVDIAAPGTNILSLSRVDGATRTMTGTSMSAPHVTGAVALYIATHGRDTNGDGVINGTDVANIKAALISSGWQQGDPEYFTGDPDSFPEPLLNVEAFVSSGGTGMSVAITSPSEGATVSGNVAIAADATDDGSITEVEFYVDESLIGTDTDGSNGWTASWDSTAYTDGGYVLTATATDDETHTSSTSIAVSVDNIDSAPIANAGGPYTVPEGGSVLLDASGSTDPDLPNDSLTYAWDFDYDGIFDDAIGVSPTFDATGLALGSLVDVAVLVTDSSDLSDIAAATVEVLSASPERTYTSTGDSVRIGDMKTVTSTVLASYSEPIDALNVRIDLTHSDAANLEVRLLDPNAEALILASVLGSGDLYYGVVIPDGTSLVHSGTWTLEITDGLKDRKRGTLYDWSLIVNPTTPLSTEAAAGASAAASVDALDLLMAGLGGTTSGAAADDDSDRLFGSLQDDVAIDLLFA